CFRLCRVGRPWFADRIGWASVRGVAGAAGHKLVLRVGVVPAWGCAADVAALADVMSQCDLGRLGLRRYFEDRWEDPTREVVDQCVRPHVAGDVRQIPIGESEDLPLLVCAVGGIVLGGPRLAEDVAEPSTGVYRVDD